MPEIFDSSNHTDTQTDDEQESLDEQRKLLRGVRRKRGFARSAQRSELEKEYQGELGERQLKHRSVDEYSEVMRRQKPARNPLLAFAAKPFNTFFSTQDTNEHIILVLRKHPITQLKWLVIAILLAIFPFIFNSIDILGFLPPSYQFAGLVLWYLLLTGFILESFLTWFFNVYIITDERIIDVDFLSLIYRNISSAKIDNIEDVTAVTGGAIRALFNFGSVSIQTAAEKREFEFEDVPRPAEVTKLINELLLEEEREKIEGRVT